MLSMSEVTPISERTYFDHLQNLYRQNIRFTWKARVKNFVDFLISEDTKFCKDIDHEAYKSQREIIVILQRTTVFPD